jgi:hypothetical protein
MVTDVLDLLNLDQSSIGNTTSLVASVLSNILDATDVCTSVAQVSLRCLLYRYASSSPFFTCEIGIIIS